MSRKLPIYLVLDVSGSMHGEPITAVENGVQTMVAALQNEPQALETAFLSVITFSDTPQQVVPLTELALFKPPALTAGGCTSLGETLKYVAACADREVAKNTAETKGDYKPLVFLMTDGAPTDHIENGLNEFKKYRWGMVIACAAGGNADTDTLKKITESVVMLDTADTASFAAFFKWVSASVTAQSKSIGSGNKEINSIEMLPPPPPEITLL